MKGYRHGRTPDARVLVANTGELHALAQRLEREPVAVAGVAMAERLLGAHDLPLYGSDAARLRQELRRIAFALELRDDPSSPTT